MHTTRRPRDQETIVRSAPRSIPHCLSIIINVHAYRVYQDIADNRLTILLSRSTYYPLKDEVMIIIIIQFELDQSNWRIKYSIAMN